MAAHKGALAALLARAMTEDAPERAVQALDILQACTRVRHGDAADTGTELLCISFKLVCELLRR